MLLRRELDRSLKDVRAAAGTANASTIDLPEHLAELRNVLVNGRTDDAIEMLRRPEYDRDAVARLLLANLLSFEGLHSDAIHIYDQVLELGDEHRHAALIAKADALLASGRAEESLTLFERVRVERSDLSEAIDGRARALQRLGRIAEAEEALKQYVAIAGHRSELRVRSR
jgi:tetratricopeptide (TPR) repeat protein